MDFAQFEWDSAKEQENIRKHRVSFADARLAFEDPRRVVAQDLAHSATEPRYYCFGRIDRGIVTVRFTWRSGVARIIGAGFWRKGRVAYEKQGSLHG